MTVSNTSCRGNVATWKLRISPFSASCSTSPKTVANDGLSPNTSANGTPSISVFADGSTREFSTASKKNFRCKLLIERNLQHLRWIAPTSKSTPMARVRRKKRPPIHRQKSRRADDENPLGRSGRQVADCPSIVAGIGGR